MPEKQRPLIVGKNALAPRNGLFGYHLLRMIPKGDSISSKVGRGLAIAGIEIVRSVKEARTDDTSSEPPVHLYKQ
ncbi:MAG: hypothetical protein AAB478_03670 [Patescibacteria group bacterium]